MNAKGSEDREAARRWKHWIAAAPKEKIGILPARYLLKSRDVENT